MRIHLFAHGDAHIRKSLEFLDEANLAWVEHKAAAEHHAALAKMYGERIARIEAEIHNAQQAPQTLLTRQPADEPREAYEHSKNESVVVYPSRATRL